MNDELLKKIKENDLTIEEWLKMRVTEEYEKALINKIDELQSNWNSLRELIEKEKTRLAKECSHTYEDSLGKTKSVNEDIFNELNKISNRMNELEGKDKNER